MISLPLAHALVAREDLPIPAWLFAWAASVVLIVSFFLLSTLWRKPRFEREDFRPLSLASRLLPERRKQEEGDDEDDRCRPGKQPGGNRKVRAGDERMRQREGERERDHPGSTFRPAISFSPPP